MKKIMRKLFFACATVVIVLVAVVLAAAIATLGTFTDWLSGNDQ